MTPQSLRTKYLKLATLICIAGLMQACTNLTFQVEVDDPEPSKEQFVSNDQDRDTTLAYTSQLAAQPVHAKGPLLNYVYQQDKKAIDPDQYFFKALTQELAARKLPVAFSDSSQDQLLLRNYETIAHRSNGFSPLVMISLVKLDLVQQGQSHRIAAIVKRAKVPIWTVTEDPLVEATINQPQELLVKEVSAKINQALFNNQLSDASVDRLAAEIKANTKDEDIAYQKVYELGFSNNPRALAALREFSNSNAEYIRLAAISGMGMLGGDQVLAELQGLYNTGRQWQDRAMALKAIGDIHSPAALDFLRQEQQQWLKDSSLEGSWNQKILSLYLD